MRLCKRCFKKFDENDNIGINPPKELGNLFLKSIGINDTDDLCPECKERLGIINILGFNE